MRRRLRKKKHLGEFKQLGFDMEGDLRPDLPRPEEDAFIERLLQFVEARDLGFGGSVGRGAFGGFVSRDRGSSTEDDRTACATFLESDPAVMRHEVGALRDAWY
jgi:uncharacterized protein YggL (DUF469 family)